MKALNIDMEYYLFPEKVESLDEFIDFIENTDRKYAKLTALSDENCVPPFFISEDTDVEYQRIDSLFRVKEEDITILNRDEYNKRLLQVEKEICRDCQYDEPGDWSDEKIIENSKNKLSLDGRCLRIEEGWDDE